MWQVIVPAAIALASQGSKQRHERKMARQASGKTDYTPFIYLGIGYLMLDKVFGKSKDDKAAEQQNVKTETAALKDNPFSVSTYKLPKKEGYSRKVAPAVDLLKAAQQIWDAIGYVTDDESKIMSAIKVARTKIDIYIMAGLYDSKYKSDLYTDLKKNLSKTELGNINTYVNKLPEYVKGVTN